jgi:hypothetical protein
VVIGKGPVLDFAAATAALGSEFLGGVLQNVFPPIQTTLFPETADFSSDVSAVLPFSALRIIGLAEL